VGDRVELLVVGILFEDTICMITELTLELTSTIPSSGLR